MDSKKASKRKVAAEGGGGSSNSNGENVLRFHHMANFSHTLAVHAHMASFHQLGRQAAVLHKACIDEPFVDALGQFNPASFALGERPRRQKVNWGPLVFPALEAVAAGAQVLVRGLAYIYRDG